MQTVAHSLLQFLREHQVYHESACEKIQRRRFSYGYCLFDVPLHYKPLALMGTTAVEALNTNTQQQVRVVHDDLTDLHRTVQELGILTYLSHPIHLVQLETLGVSTLQKSKPHVLKFYADAEYTLAEMQSLGLLKYMPATQMRCLMTQTLLGLRYLHKQGIVLGCLRPDCLYVTTRLCTATTPPCRNKWEDEALAGAKVQIGQAGDFILKGEPPYPESVISGYSSPEIVLDMPCTAAADTFSVGCILFQFLGQSEPPFPPEASRLGRADYFLCSYDPAALMEGSAVSSKDPVFAAVIQSMLHEVADRRPSIASVLQDPFFQSQWGSPCFLQDTAIPISADATRTPQRTPPFRVDWVQRIRSLGQPELQELLEDFIGRYDHGLDPSSLQCLMIQYVNAQLDLHQLEEVLPPNIFAVVYSQRVKSPDEVLLWNKKSGLLRKHLVL